MPKLIQIEGLSEQTIEILNNEAKKRRLSRNQLLQIVIGNFTKNAELNWAEKTLNEPLEDVANQLNLLTTAMNNSAKNMSSDLKILIAINQKFLDTWSQLMDDN